MTLDELPEGVTALVSGLEAAGSERRRLTALGFFPGGTVQAELVSPLGDPVAYRVLGSLVVLRKGQARGIHVDPVPAPGDPLAAGVGHDG